MVEGIRFLPFFYEALNRHPQENEILGDCAKCKMRNDLTIRQTMGCGYEPPNPSLPVVPPNLGHSEIELTTCPGYSCKLPEVIEVARLHLHWSKGQLNTVLRGGELTEPAQQGIEILEGARNELHNKIMSRKPEGSA